MTQNTAELDEIGVCNRASIALVPFEPYVTNRDTGGFILIDELTNVPSGVDPCRSGG